MLTGSQQTRRCARRGYLGWEDDQGRLHDAVLADGGGHPLLLLALAWQVEAVHRCRMTPRRKCYTTVFRNSIIICFISNDKNWGFIYFVPNLGKLSNRKSNETWELVQIKKSQVSVGNSSKLLGESSEIKKVPSSSGYQRLKNNDWFSSYEDPKT